MRTILNSLRAIELEIENLVLTISIGLMRYMTITVMALKVFLGVFFVLGLVTPFILGYNGHGYAANIVASIAMIVCGFLWTIVAMRTSLLAAGIDLSEGLTPDVIRNKIPFFQDNNTSTTSIGAKIFQKSFLFGMWIISVLGIPAILPSWNLAAYVGAIAALVPLTFYVAYNWEDHKEATKALRAVWAMIFCFNVSRMLLPGYDQLLLVAMIGMMYVFLVRHHVPKPVEIYADITMGIIAILLVATNLFPGTFSQITGWNNGKQAYEQQEAQFSSDLQAMRQKGIDKVNAEIQPLEQERINNHGALNEAKQKQLDELYAARERIKTPPQAPKTEAATQPVQAGSFNLPSLNGSTTVSIPTEVPRPLFSMSAVINGLGIIMVAWLATSLLAKSEEKKK